MPAAQADVVNVVNEPQTLEPQFKRALLGVSTLPFSAMDADEHVNV